MTNSARLHTITAAAFLLLTGCGKPPAAPVAVETKVAAPSGDYRVYITNEASGDLTVIDSANHDVVATVKLGKRPRGIRASHDGKTIYVALSGSPFAPPGVDASTLPPPDRASDGVGVFDVRENKLVEILRCGQDPEQFDLSKDGKLLYVSNEDAATTSVVDLASKKIVATVPVGDEPEGVTIRPDGKVIYVTSEDEGTVYAIDTATNKTIKSVKAGTRPRAIAFLPDGSRAYVSSENGAAVGVIDGQKHEFRKAIQLGPRDVKPMGLVLSPDASKLYVTTGRFHKVFVIATATDTVLDSFEVGERPWGIGISPDGKTLYTANGPSGDVSVIDVASKAVTKKVKAGDRPWGVLVLPVAK